MSRPRGAIAMALLCLASRAHATYSITGADTATGLVGGAGASCVPYEVIVIYASAPDHGAFNVQAGFDDPARDQAVALLANGATPDEVIAAVSDATVHPEAPQMQYGVVDTLGRTAAYTGPDAQAYAGHRSGEAGTFAYTAQGNILTSAAVLEQAAAAFESAGCDLPDRLMRALEAGADGGEGDSRCTDEGLPARSAYLQVDRPGEPAGSWLRISVPDVTPDDPIVALRAAYDAWRLDHPCPAIEIPGAGSGGDDDGAAVDTGAAGGAAPAGGGCSVGVPAMGSRMASALAIALLLAANRRRRRAARPR
ncbi:MAG: DUF1028 domain-containing protein [Polyangiaceae bacterium]